MIPEYVKTKPLKVQQGWETTYKKYSVQGHEYGVIAANTWLLEQKKKEKVVRTTLKFDVNSSQGFLKRSDDGEDYISLVLNSIIPNKDGKTFTEKILNKWAEQINSKGIVGDIDHGEYDRLLMSGMTDEEVMEHLKGKPGIAKAIKAVVQDGKLWVRAFIDKRYRKIIEKAKGVSSESFVTCDDNNNVVDGDILGFTFNVMTEPADYEARAVV